MTQEGQGQGRILPLGPEADALRGALLEIYVAAITSEYPADQVVGFYLRKHPAIRGTARRFLPTALFALFRKRVRTVVLAAQQTGALPMMDPAADFRSPIEPPLEALAALFRWLAEEFQLPTDLALAVMESAKAHAPEVQWPRFDGMALDGGLLPPPWDRAARLSIPPAFLARWDERLGVPQAVDFALSLHEPAPLQLRVNEHLISGQGVRDFLAATGIASRQMIGVPAAVELVGKVNLKALPGWDPAWAEVQDVGSQLIAAAVAPSPGWRILDACAGGGGKALALAASHPRCTVDAWDLDPERLAPLADRATRAHLANITALAEKPAAHAQWDAVLVDAPCLGLGRLRRDPAALWKDAPLSRLQSLARIQLDCLSEYAPLVRPGGVLVYATCSFEAEETTGVVEAFLAANPAFRPDPLPAPLDGERWAQTRSADVSQLVLLPSLHGTDGFFIARFRANR